MYARSGDTTVCMYARSGDTTVCINIRGTLAIVPWMSMMAGTLAA
jgi:hypothetical protein